MSEQYDESTQAEQETPADREQAPAADAEATGHPVVDAVLADLEGVSERPPAEQVAAFESAHDRLRSALADAGNGQDPTR